MSSTNESEAETVCSSRRLYNFERNTRAQQTAISSRGALALHAAGKAHKWTSEKAREAAAKSWATRRARIQEVATTCVTAPVSECKGNATK